LAAQDTVSLEKHQALQQEFESYKFNQKQLNGSETSSLQLQLSEYQAQLRAESHRLAAVEKERDDLFSSVNSLNEKIASMEAASASRAIESANSIHRLDLQYQDILVMVQEKQRDLARFASIESVPFDIYQSAKKQFQNLHEELETYKIKAGEKLGAVEASLKAEVSKGQAQLNSECERLAAVESERSELYKTVNALNEQIANMRAASASQAVEAANTLGSLSKQYKDIFQVVQEKSQELASLKAADIKILQDDDTSGDAESVKQMYQALLHEFASYKTNADEKLRGVETALQSQVKGMMKQLDNVISQLESTDDAMARRLVAAEKERSELNSTVSSLTEQLATMQIGSASALDRTVVVSPQGKESGRFDDYEAIKTRYSDLQMEFEKYKMNANGKIAGLEASLQASLTDSKSMLTSENIKTLLERSVREIVHEFEEKAGSSPSRAGKCDSSEAVNVSAVTESNLTARAGFHSARASAARFDISSAASRRELSSAASTSSTASISSAASNPPKSGASIVQAARSSFGSSQSSFGTPSAPKPNVMYQILQVVAA
jgi:chromosome segregation ATPase